MSFCISELCTMLQEEKHSELKSKCSLIALDMKHGKLAILQFIEELKDLFTDPLLPKRQQGVFILTEVLENLPYDFLDTHQLRTLSAFYIDKLSDNHQMLPIVLKGILKIVGFKHFSGEDIPALLNALFSNVACQQQNQADRYTIYRIFQLALEKHKEALLSMKLDLVYGVISSIDGERDPRNLMFLFKWLKLFLMTVPLGHLSEEMFEVIACYFPIDFRAPSNNVNSISRDDLANELCPCLCAVPEFADNCITLALEKLESSLEIAKYDSLQLLRDGCSVFSSSVYLKYAMEIWSQLQREIFCDADNAIKNECLNTLKVVVHKISSENEYFTVLNNIVTTLKGNLLPGSKLFEPSTKVLFYTALATKQSSNYVIKEIEPILTNTFVISPSPKQKAIVLKTLTHFVKVYLQHVNERNIDNEEIFNVPVLCLKASAAEDKSLQSAGFDSLAELAEFLNLDTRLSLYRYLHNVITNPTFEDIQTSVLKCLRQFSIFYPEEANKYVVSQCEVNDNYSLNSYLKALCSIASINHFKEIVTESLLGYAVNANTDMALISLKNIRALLEEGRNNTEMVQIFLQKGTVNKLVEYAVTIVNTDLLIEISSVLKLVIGSQDYETQSLIIEWQTPFINNCCEDPKEMYIFILDGLLSRLNRGWSTNRSMIAFLTTISIRNNNDLTRDVAVQLLANLINKHPNDNRLVDYINTVKEDCLKYYDSCKNNVIITLSWITKALVMRDHTQAIFWIEMLLQLLEEDAEVSEGFKIIMNDNYESLSSVSHCIKTLLYQQKCFMLVTNKICTKFSPGKVSYLIALGYLMEYVPEQVLALQFEKIVKLVILCLEQCNNPEVLCVLLNRIKNLIRNDEQILQTHIEDFLSRFLPLTMYEQSMKVRIAALQCVVEFTSLPLYKILPFKQKVLDRLSLCTDDKKRLVRKEAMEARSVWFLLDAPM